jgi:hypothetical protein
MADSDANSREKLIGEVISVWRSKKIPEKEGEQRKKPDEREGEGAHPEKDFFAETVADTRSSPPSLLPHSSSAELLKERLFETSAALTAAEAQVFV